MLIFVQVYRTIDKIWYIYKVLEEQKRAKVSTKRKLEAPEEKCSWSTKGSWSDDVIRSKFIRSKITRSWSSSGAEELKALKAGISLSCLRVAKDIKKCINGLEMDFEDLRCLLFQESWKRTSVRTVQPPSPLLWSCFATRQG